MKLLYTQDGAIVAIGEGIVETAEAFIVNGDSHWGKNLGVQLGEVADAELPPDFAPGRYTFEGGALVAVPPVVDPLQVQADTIVAIQTLLDTTAKAHGYDHIVSVISYVGSSIPKWHAEGTRAKAWRDECWYAAYLIQEAVIAGTRPLPTVAEVLGEMPAANWPV
jgi:hypothetical protein